jgi:hypothetical protein
MPSKKLNFELVNDRVETLSGIAARQIFWRGENK